MSLTNYPDGLTSFGMPLLGSGPIFTTGKIFFVDSVKGSDDNDGLGKDKALATIDAAVGKCTADEGDYILVMAKHTETYTAAAALDLDVAGITVQGIGHGENRPVLVMGGSTVSVDIDVDAADISFKGIQITQTLDAITAVIDVNAKDFLLEDCEFRSDEGGSKAQMLIAVDIGGSANDCDRAHIKNCKFTSETAGANSAIKLTEVQEGVIIEGCTIFGDYEDAGIHNPSGKILTNLQLVGNIVRNLQAGDHAIEIVSACTGWAVGNRMIGDTIGTIFDPGALFCVDNQEVDAIDQGSVASPRTPASFQEGTVFIVKKALTATAITTGGVDVSGPSSGGELLVEDFILQSDGTGLGGTAGSDFTLNSDNTNGSGVFCSNTVGAMGTDILLDKKTVAVGKSHVLESGKKVTAKCTTAACTGAGIINVYLLCRRLADNVSLAAA